MAARPENYHEVIIVGGGPSGLSAALVLARCRREVLLIDAGRPRNWASHHVGGFFTRDGIHPRELLRLGREELAAYECVECREGEVISVSRIGERFHVSVKGDPQTLQCRRLLLATGIYDELPPLPGIEPLWGTSVFVCPICNGWEVRDRPLAVYGVDADGADLAIEMLAWSRDVVLCTHGAGRVPAATIAKLRGGGIRVFESPIARLEGTDGRLECVHFVDGTPPLHREALFFSTPQFQQTGLPHSLGCQFAPDGTVRRRSRCEATNVPGLYVTGNASACGGTQLAIVAAGEGAEVAHAIHCALAEEDFARGHRNTACAGE
jgi:thioredoxin reductase